MNYTETNQLIDVFMGNDIVTRPAGEVAPRKDAYYYVTPESNIYLGLTERISLFEAWNMELRKMKYHTSWDWLFPVLEKITSLNPDAGRLWFEYEISQCHCYIRSNKGLEIRNNWDSSLGATYRSVLQFIQWYNQNQK